MRTMDTPSTTSLLIESSTSFPRSSAVPISSAVPGRCRLLPSIRQSAGIETSQPVMQLVAVYGAVVVVPAPVVDVVPPVVVVVLAPTVVVVDGAVSSASCSLMRSAC